MSPAETAKLELIQTRLWIIRDALAAAKGDPLLVASGDPAIDTADDAIGILETMFQPAEVL